VLTDQGVIEIVKAELSYEMNYGELPLPMRLMKIPGIGKKPPNACCWSSREKSPRRQDRRAAAPRMS